MSLKTLIIDDEPIALEKLKSYVEKTPSLLLAGACGNGIEAAAFLSADKPDLIITDINMPDLNGMDFVKTLSDAPMIIFTTAYPQYAVESYKVSAVDYILKPYGYVEFTKAVNKALELHAAKNACRPQASHPELSDSLFVKTDYRYVRVSLSDIRFIKGYGEYLQIYTTDKSTPIVTLSSFAAIKERLPENFLQVHRSYIINMNQVEQIERNRVVMDAENYIPVGDSYKLTFLDYLNSHAVGKAAK
ncbi:response regulator transcription factor [Barnesiella sp. WM24]|uniref:LytR/AlgR family response regulator transcription factor n=1 Tax=Barnesiella sp. WM24 TaxID=2558278 RepID=UPI0010718EC8|nr:LytTR family DNA-binding domain-containing protein [Barnesiella sp. WM24]MDE6115423.1 LytTR family DNA-binding domain-containing protein [Muribaculum sp.]TFU93924.1 response regulator transcription factor [Barnesiella sp. WM24]